MASVAEIDALLPQTQCTRCGFSGCQPYAQAMADGVAQINQCPPGGTPTIVALSALLKREPLPLNPANGIEGPPLIAVIDEERCIGCTKCLPPCPVDAIVGARKQMHTVIAALCTGCELCVAPCPVDCISIIARGAEAPPSPGPRENRARYDAHERRRAHREEQHASLLAARKQMAHRTTR